MAVKHKVKRNSKKWSAKVTETSDALDLKQEVFKSKNSEKIAESLKHSADESHRRKGSPFQSAMSMLNFYINRAGKNLTKTQKKPLERAKNKLRKLYGRPLK
ncbi:DUF3175 domain-containing protein [Mucilaginibacter lutimaris]|uniref:DUF3175 domain-containing protein n=1 Tax=Mucilaginibacter lutimaris TaxID=931629 RepID=A0ABW2ZLT8_9SPHI